MILHTFFANIKNSLYLVFFSFFACFAPAEPGVSEKTVLFGQSAVLSGPAGRLGKNMRDGILSAFREINQKGGVHGRHLKLVTLDDAYEPERAVLNTRALIKKHQVFSLIGGVGTPTSKAVLPIISEVLIPYIAPFTGAEILRGKNQKYVVNLRASYNQEIQYIVDRLVSQLNKKRVAVIYQDDSFGRAGLSGLNKALKKHQLLLVSKGVYLRNTTAVKIALLEIMAKNPEAVMIVGPYLPAAEFIKKAVSLDFNPVFAVLSFTGAVVLGAELKNNSAPVVVTGVVPSPFDSNHPLVQSYKKAIGKNFNFVSLEGYLAGRFTALVLQRMGQKPTRSGFIKTIRRMKSVSIDGFNLRFGLNDNQGSDQVFLTKIQNGTLESLKSLKNLYNSGAKGGR